MAEYLRAYTGDLPYIFVSYAHKDSNRVLPAIEAMQRRGYRVWYDCGIEAGTEWSNNIAEHLHGCAVFVAFISPNSVQSENCLDEIAYAKSHQKPSLMIYLEENVVLPQGTEMQTARFQRMYYNRQLSPDSFVDNLNGTSIFTPCIGEASPMPVAAKTPAAPALNGKTIGILLGVLAVVIAAVIGIVLLAGGSDDEPKPNEDPATTTTVAESDSTTTEPQTTTTTKAPVAEVEMSDDPEDYTFKLEGVVYQLPFAFTQMTDNGWTITTSGYSSTTEIPGMTKTYIAMAKDGKRVEVRVYNDTGNTIPVADCWIGSIDVDARNGLNFEIAKGITPASTPDEIKAAFGTPYTTSTSDDYDKLYYGKEEYADSGLTFYCYNEASGMKDHSSLEMSNFVVLRETETNEAVPDYLSQYKAPTALGTDATSGNVQVEGVLYRLPAPVQLFLDNGWSFSKRPASIISGGSESVSLSKGDMKLEIYIANYAAYQTIPENCVVTAVYAYDTSKFELILPGNIKIGSTLTQAETALTTPFERRDSTYSYSFSYTDYDGRRSSITVYVDIESKLVDSINYSFKNWDYE